MSRRVLNAAIGGAAAVAAAATLVATGVIDLDRFPGRKPAPEAAALVAPAAVAPAAEAVAPAPESAPQPEQSAQPAPEALPEPKPDLEADPQTAQAPVVGASDPETPRPDTTTALPAFDLVRAEPGGSTLVAGAGAPGATIEVMVDGSPVADAQVGDDGRFVAFLDIADSSKAHVVTLVQKQAGKESVSDEEVIITPAPAVPDQLATARPTLPAAPSAEAPAPAAAETSAETAPAPALITAAPAITRPEPGAAPGAIAAIAVETPKATAPQQITAAPTPQAPAVLLSSVRGVEVLQTAPLAAGDVALDAISYDEEGEVLLSGRGQETAFVRVYLDNAPLATSRIRDDGRWRITLPQVDIGTYTLRVDQLSEAGEVIARVESPFLRESPEVLLTATTDGPVTAITVQPGNTLWAIARDRYGEGLDYLKVYQANKDRIRDPDLIYPGQIFDLPVQ